jgi:hypothetical protein
MGLGLTPGKNTENPTSLRPAHQGLPEKISLVFTSNPGSHMSLHGNANTQFNQTTAGSFDENTKLLHIGRFIYVKNRHALERGQYRQRRVFHVLVFL